MNFASLRVRRSHRQREISHDYVTSLDVTSRRTARWRCDMRLTWIISHKYHKHEAFSLVKCTGRYV